MSYAKFTPGPWHVAGATGCRMVATTKTAKSGVICDVWGKGREIHEANAALIAAAPDTYEYAETTMKVLQLLLDTYKLPEQVTKCLQERIETAKELTKKSRGEE